MTRNECLEILELPSDASRDDIVKAFRQLAQVWHPDRFPNNVDLQQKANAKLAKINEAYQCLRDEKFTKEPKATNKQKSNEWFYTIDGEKKGPIKTSELVRLAASGILKPDDLVWKEGFPEWVPARQIKGLNEVFPRPKPSVVTIDISTGPVTSFRQRKRSKVPAYVAGLMAMMIVVVLLMLWPGRKPRFTERLVESPNTTRIEPNVANESLNNKGRVADSNELPSQNREVETEQDSVEQSTVSELMTASAPERQKPVVNKNVIWRRFRHPKGGAEIDMPDEAEFNPFDDFLPPEPGVLRMSLPLPGINLDHIDQPTTFTAGCNDFRCSLAVNKLRAFAVKEIERNATEFANQVKDNGDLQRFFLEGHSRNRITSDTKLQLGEARGREFQIELPQNIIVVRWYMTRTHECTATIVFPKDRDATNERERFFNSLLIDGRSNETPDVDETIPQNIREYFHRAERIRISHVKSLEQRIDELKTSLMNTSPQFTANLRRQLSHVEKARDELKAFRKPIAPLPLPMEVGDIGFQEQLVRVIVWDKNLITASLYESVDISTLGYLPLHMKPEREISQDVVAGEARKEFIVRNVDASKISKTNKDRSGFFIIWSAKAIFKVVATKPDPELLQRFPERPRQRMTDHPVLELVKTPSDIEKYRDLFYQMKKAQEEK